MLENVRLQAINEMKQSATFQRNNAVLPQSQRAAMHKTTRSNDVNTTLRTVDNQSQMEKKMNLAVPQSEQAKNRSVMTGYLSRRNKSQRSKAFDSITEHTQVTNLNKTVTNIKQTADDEHSQRCYSRNVRLTSNEKEFDPARIMQMLRQNKINHRKYDPSIVNQEWRKHFQEILNKSQNVQKFSIKKEFVQKFGVRPQKVVKEQKKVKKEIVVLENPQEIHTQEDITNYKSGIQLSHVFKHFNTIFKEKGSHAESRSLSEVRKTQDYQEDHFLRNISRKSNQRQLQMPDYLGLFHYQKDPDISDKYEAVKSGKYNLDEEEHQFNQILKKIQNKHSDISKDLSKVGLLNYNPTESKRGYLKLEQYISEQNSKQENSVQNDKTLAHSQTPFFPNSAAASRGFKRAQTQHFGGRNRLFKTLNLKLQTQQTRQSSYRAGSSRVEKAASPLSNSEVRKIWETAKNYESTIPDQTSEIKEIREEQKKMQMTLDYLQHLKSDLGDVNNESMEQDMKNFYDEKQFQNEENDRNFLSKEIIQKIKEEGLKNSSFIRLLQGTTGAKSYTIWKPQKLRFTKIGPRIEEAFNKSSL